MATNLAKKYYTLTIKNFWEDHKKDRKKSKKKFLEYKVYVALMRDFFLEISKLIIYQRWSFVIPYKLGVIQLKSRKRRNENEIIVDYNLSRQKKKTIQHLNLHTFGKIYYTEWMKTHLNFRNRVLYTFKMAGGPLAKKNGVGKPGIFQMIQEYTKDPLKKLF